LPGGPGADPGYARKRCHHLLFALIAGLVLLHDRSIDVASAMGSGTTFSFQLPVNSSAYIFIYINKYINK
jgi:hypothetical protein